MPRCGEGTVVKLVIEIDLSGEVPSRVLRWGAVSYLWKAVTSDLQHKYREHKDTKGLDYLKPYKLCELPDLGKQKVIVDGRVAATWVVEEVINAGKRAKEPNVPEPDPPKERNGVVPCPKCGRRIAPARRKHPHEGSDECLAQQVVNDYAARDWVQCFNVTQSTIILQAGVPFEWALGGTHSEASNKFDEFGRGGTETHLVRHQVGFCPKNVMRVALLMTKISFPPELRRRALAALWEKPEQIEAIEAMRRLSGNVRAAIYEAVQAYDLARGVEPRPLQWSNEDEEELEDEDIA